MRGDRIRSFVTRSGQVVRARVEEVRHRPPRREPVDGEREARAYARQGQRRPAGAGRGAAGGAAIGNVDMPRLAAFVVLGVVFIFVIMLAVAGIYRAGKWAFGERDRLMEVRVENSHRDMETAASQKSIPRRPLSYTSAGSSVNEVGVRHAVPVQRGHEQAQPRREVAPHQQQQAPVVSREPVVDYQSSMREMEKVLDSQEIEIKRLTESLRNMRKGD